MALVSLDQIDLEFSGEPLLQGVSLQIRRGDRLALVGRNGSGKTSLLRIIKQQLEASSGNVVSEKGIRIGYLEQQPELDGDSTLLDTVIASRAELVAVRDEIARLQEAAENGDTQVVTRLGELQERYQREGGDDLERKATIALQNVGFDQGQFDQSAGMLSGGEKNRVLLARILMMDADLLLLDEPTNHLDIRGTEFLEEYLSTFNGGAIVVSHDRSFIDRFATAIVAIEPDCSVQLYPGNFERYREIQKERFDKLVAEREQQKKFIEKNEELIRRTHAAKGQKSRQAKSRQKALDKLEIIEAPPVEKGVMGLSFDEVEHSGKVVFQAKEITLRPGGQTLLDNVSFKIARRDRVGIIGPNGCGKTTLIKNLAGQEEPQSGKVQEGYRAMIGYYDQTLSGLTTGRTILEELTACRPELSEQVLRGVAGRFLFHGDDVHRKVETFSGGEQSRLALALLVLGRHNVLLLDEPTNHLDFPSQEVLEEALAEFQGTLVVVSHDRYFLDRTCQRILSIENRTIVDDLGTYSELRKSGRIMKDTPKKAPSINPKKQKQKEDYQARKKTQRSQESTKKRIFLLENTIQEQEKRIKKLVAEMADPARAFDWEGLEELQQEKKQIEKEHALNLEEWERLNAELGNN
jgi:ATP-binding cassette subfamily F protein 3